MLLSLFIISLVFGFLFLGYYFYRDRKYLKKPTREVLGPELKREIEEERKDFNRRRTRFEKALGRAQIRVRARLSKRPPDKPAPFA